jgi:hypothetical protein
MFFGGFRPVTSIIVVGFCLVIMVMKLFKSRSKHTSDISWLKESVFVLGQEECPAVFSGDISVCIGLIIKWKPIERIVLSNYCS